MSRRRCGERIVHTGMIHPGVFGCRIDQRLSVVGRIYICWDHSVAYVALHFTSIYSWLIPTNVFACLATYITFPVWPPFFYSLTFFHLTLCVLSSTSFCYWFNCPVSMHSACISFLFEKEMLPLTSFLHSTPCHNHFLSRRETIDIILKRTITKLASCTS